MGQELQREHGAGSCVIAIHEPGLGLDNFQTYNMAILKIWCDQGDLDLEVIRKLKSHFFQN